MNRRPFAARLLDPCLAHTSFFAKARCVVFWQRGGGWASLPVDFVEIQRQKVNFIVLSENTFKLSTQRAPAAALLSRLFDLEYI